MIKLFEEYNKYYTEIGNVEYNSRKKRQTPFTVSQLSQLSKHKKDYTIGTSLDDKVIWIISNDINSRVIKIDQDDDEWFFIEDRGLRSTYYKCDQFEGVCKILSDII